VSRSAAARGTRLLVVVAAVLLGYVVLDGLRTPGRPSAGPPAGGRMPPFAAPLATSSLQGDVNVATAETAGGPAGARPACEVRGREVLNGCDLWRDGPAALAFLATRSTGCTRALDQLERLRRRHPGVRVAAVAVRGDRGDVRRLVRARGWRFPVAYDADGVLANLYGVSVCPHLTLARAGGAVAGTVLGETADAALDRRLAALAP
jgi:hypothetical protein